jgi:hypothetical protein
MQTNKQTNKQTCPNMQPVIHIAKPGCRYTTHEHSKHASGCCPEQLICYVSTYPARTLRDRYLLWRSDVRSVHSSLLAVHGATERRAPILRYIRLSHPAFRKRRHSSLTFFPFTVLTMTVHFTGTHNRRDVTDVSVLLLGPTSRPPRPTLLTLFARSVTLSRALCTVFIRLTAKQ